MVNLDLTLLTIILDVNGLATTIRRKCCALLPHGSFHHLGSSPNLQGSWRFHYVGSVI